MQFLLKNCGKTRFWWENCQKMCDFCQRINNKCEIFLKGLRKLYFWQMIVKKYAKYVKRWRFRRRKLDWRLQTCTCTVRLSVLWLKFCCCYIKDYSMEIHKTIDSVISWYKLVLIIFGVYRAASGTVCISSGFRNSFISRTNTWVFTNLYIRLKVDMCWIWLRLLYIFQ